MAMVVVLIIASTVYSFFRGEVSAPSVDLIEKTVKEYLTENPEVVIAALQKYQENQQKEQQANVSATVKQHYDALAFDKHSAVMGNPEGDVTVVEFLDYACGYCKRAYPNIVKLIENDKNVRVVIKEFPILSPVSEIAARVAISANMIAPENYGGLHEKLITSRLSSEEEVLKVAEGAGYNKDEIKQKMSSEDVTKAIEENRKLGQLIGVNGTPAFVIGQTLVPGAIDYDVMKGLVEEARKSL
jgi:protein-disulfide isomerase